MNSDDIIKELKNVSTEVHKKGEIISPEALVKYIESLENDAEESRKFYEAEFKARSEASLEMFKSVIISGQSAIRSAILINGGAFVALLVFIGKIWSESTSQIASSLLSSGIAFFSSGVLAGAVAAGFTYLSQLCYSHHHMKTGMLSMV